MRSGRISLSDLSIKHRLPLLIGILLLATIIGLTWASYGATKQAAIAVGRERLLNLTQQLATLLQQSASVLIAKTQTAANHPDVRSVFQSKASESEAKAKTVLLPFSPANDPNALQIELWRTDGSLALIIPESLPPEGLDLNQEFKQAGVDSNKSIGALRIFKGNPLYPLVAASKDESGKVIGYLVRWRRVTAPDARRQLADLFGSDAALYIGNAQGEVWTDLVQVVSKPPLALGATLETVQYKRDGEPVLALGRPITGTPWFMIVEFPARAFLQPARRVLRSMVLIGLTFLIVGVLGAFFLSKNITRPLQSLTNAAVAISGGDYSRNVDLNQKDELGTLANAFNTMGSKIRADQAELERKIRELRQSNEQRALMTQQLWQASKLATMGELAASIAHELNNPLAIVSLRTEFLDQQLAANDPKREEVAIIAKEVERMASLVSNLLVFSRRSHPQISTVDLREELTNSLEFIHYHLRNRKITIIKEFAENLPTIQADRQQLRQVFLNLLTNASDAMNDGGTLTVRAHRGLLEGATAVILEFSDTGIGIEPEDMPKLWESFFTTKPEGKGTGLGLPICRRTIEEHRGSIEIESMVGLSTTVRIALPATAQ